MGIRILIADDHKIMREGLKALVGKETDITVVGEAESGKETISQVQKLSPGIVVMDIAMPDLNGIEATRKITKINKNVKVVALSAHADQHFIREMMAAGASAYVLKDTAYEELVRAIREVMKGKKYLSPDITRGVLDSFVNLPRTTGTNPAFAVLTDREREALQLIAEGKSTKEIAGAMEVSVKTVETHRHNIMEKLDMHSIAELTKYAIREGVTSIDG
ncbi:MAG: response regulator transcription factor [Kiritimatiellia bacterium]